MSRGGRGPRFSKQSDPPPPCLVAVKIPERLYLRLYQIAALEHRSARYYVNVGLRRVLRSDRPLPVRRAYRGSGSALRRYRTHLPHDLYVALRFRALRERLPLVCYVVAGLCSVFGDKAHDWPPGAFEVGGDGADCLEGRTTPDGADGAPRSTRASNPAGGLQGELGALRDMAPRAAGAGPHVARAVPQNLPGPPRTRR